MTMGKNWFLWGALVVALWLTARIILQALTRPSQPAEPGDTADRMAPLRPRPKSGAAAVALAEPDEDGELTVHPPFFRRTRSR
jgi:hypothetical protein